MRRISIIGIVSTSVAVGIVTMLAFLFTSVASATDGYDGDHKIKVCHNGHVIEVDYHAAKAHEAHGDKIGWRAKYCEPLEPGDKPCPEPPQECPTCPAGPPGPEGPQGPPGEPATSTNTETLRTVVVVPEPEPTCLGDRVAKDTILTRARGVRNLRAWFEGTRIKATRVATPDPAPSSNARKLRKWTIKVDLRGLPRGNYVVRVRYSKAGKQRTQVHYHRVCYGNVNGGYGEGMNASTRIIL